MNNQGHVWNMSQRVKGKNDWWFHCLSSDWMLASNNKLNTMFRPAYNRLICDIKTQI